MTIVIVDFKKQTSFLRYTEITDRDTQTDRDRHTDQLNGEGRRKKARKGRRQKKMTHFQFNSLPI